MGRISNQSPNPEYYYPLGLPNPINQNYPIQHQPSYLDYTNEVGIESNETRLLKEHKGRLEVRMQMLEDHNKQLERQLQKLRQFLANTNPMTDQTNSVLNHNNNSNTGQIAHDVLVLPETHLNNQSLTNLPINVKQVSIYDAIS